MISLPEDEIFQATSFSPLHSNSAYTLHTKPIAPAFLIALLPSVGTFVGSHPLTNSENCKAGFPAGLAKEVLKKYYIFKYRTYTIFTRATPVTSIRITYMCIMHDYVSVQTSGSEHRPFALSCATVLCTPPLSL